MKRTNLLFLLLLTFFVSSKAQEAVTLTFTANTTQGSMYCPFDAVNVTNVTRGWSETLAYPDTILVLNSTVGLGEQFCAFFRLGKAHPNPFKDEAIILLETPVTGEVCIQVFRIDGTSIIKSQNHLEAGTHRVKVALNKPGMAFLVATSAQGRQVVRLLCTGNGGGDHIIVEPVPREYTPSGQFMRGDGMGEFQPGDMMRYTAVLYDGTNTIYSNTITQQQFESQIVTLNFDLTLPEVTTNQVIDIAQTTAIGVGDVVATGGVSVTERGICWSTSHNPDTNGSHASNGTGSGTYTVQMNGLTVGTTYYVRAYAINLFGTAYGNEVSFTTTQIPSYSISVSANPTNGGTVSGGGSYQQGQSCTVIATAANGYSFNNWTENGSVVSTNPNYSFTVNNNRSLVANFSVQAPNTYTINASPNPSNGGLVTGGGTYQQGQSCTVSAVANTGYTFLRWTENGNQVSTNANYTFTVTSNRTLVAQFQLQSFTISATVTPSNSGTVTGGGSYNYGQLCTLMATANTGYVFEKWTKNGTQISTEATYSFTVTESASYVAHFQLQNYTINVSANPTNGGSVAGAGSYSYGQSCTLTATANTGYTFLRWTENGNQVSTNASYTFSVTNNRFLVAQFQAQSSYTIIVSASPANGGSVSGGGTYNNGQSCTVTATSNSGYTFTNWTENSNQVSTNANYTFTVTSNRHLVANFTYNGGSNAPIGAINGLFTINSNGDQIYFSQGNLQYQASTNTWRFATNQWDCIGETNANISQTYNGWIDLFGWGTSGWNNGNVYYQPWDIQLNGGIPGHGYGPTDGTSYQYNLIGTYSHADWGIHNTINNTTGQWRTLTGGSNGEWNYIFNTRTTTSGIRYAKARVNNVNGVVLLPDDWSASYYSLSNTNTGNSSFNSNVITASQWVTLEQQGAVFLPAAGQRCGTDVNCCDYADYWSATCSDSNGADEVAFNNFDLNACTWSNRYNGCSVRLVQDDSDLPTVTTNTITNITQTTATGGGNVTNAGGSTVTARGVCWSTSHNPTVSGNHTTNGTGTGSFTSNIAGLTANTTYYVRAYATNSAGTAYGNEVSFTTLNSGGNNHEYVDLGLPSGLLWATCNVGASTPESYGNYFAWGETSPKSTYDWSTYQHCNGSANNLTKYCNDSGYGYNGYIDNLTVLQPSDDAATVNWGTNWRMPTKEEWQELLTNTTPTITTLSGVSGCLFTASNGNSLFLPAAGYRVGSNLNYAGTLGNYWSSSLYTGLSISAWDFEFDVSNYGMAYNGRAFGQSVRAVFGQSSGNNYSITISASPINGGTVSGGGTYQQGQSCTVSAVAATGYIFNNWTENGSVVSTNANYTFTVNSDRSLVAHFSAQAPNTYTISVSSNPNNGGSVTGGGTYQQGQSCTVSATANSGYTFVNWTENGNQVSSSANYTFTVNNNRILVANFSAQAPSTYTVSVSPYPINGGSVTGGGSYSYGQSCTVTATAAPNYSFLWWREYGSVVSTDASYTFTVTRDRDLLAQFGLPYYEIITIANPTNGGTVSGGNIYQFGESCTVSATAAEGYSFSNWTENGTVVSTNTSYTFTVNSSRTLVANFNIDAPTGAIDGLFTINANGDQVYFSQGNLQYHASSDTWRFAINQYDVMGNANSNISQTYNGWIDLFGWGTSGNDHGAVCYQPWSTSQTESYYYAYGVSYYGLYEQTGLADWGRNWISNGGSGNLGYKYWRTLKTEEWYYVIFARNTTSGIRFAKAKVNNVNGVILLPDNWNNSHYNLNNTNNDEAPFNSNVINSSTWTSSLEAYGAVFLPSGGSRSGTVVDFYYTNVGYYWSSSCSSTGNVRFMVFDNNSLGTGFTGNRASGRSVRLVLDF